MKTLSIRPEDIVVGERHRALSDDAVDRIAKSMADIGLKQPISVRVVDEMELDGELTAGVPILVAGAHRLAAAMQLGWTHIDCIEVEDDEITAELWEIAENLYRCDLTKEQRDHHIRRYAELLEARKSERVISGQVVQKSVGRPKETAAVIAEETGLSQRTVRRALNPRPAVVPKPALEPEDESDAIIREANAIVGAWNRARQAAREMAMVQIDIPIMDRAA